MDNDVEKKARQPSAARRAAVSAFVAQGGRKAVTTAILWDKSGWRLLQAFGETKLSSNVLVTLPSREHRYEAV